MNRPRSRYYFDNDEDFLKRDPEYHIRNLRSLLLMAEYSAMMSVECKEFLGDRLTGIYDSILKIKDILEGRDAQPFQAN